MTTIARPTTTIRAVADPTRPYAAVIAFGVTVLLTVVALGTGGGTPVGQVLVAGRTGFNPAAVN